MQQLKAQAAALRGVEDAATKAKLARIQADIAEKEEALDDTRYEHMIDMQQAGYDKLSDDANKTLEDTLKAIDGNAQEQEKIVKEMLDRIKGHYADVYGEINAIIENTGTVIDDTAKTAVGKLESTLKGLSGSIGQAFNTSANGAAKNINTNSISVGSSDTQKVVDAVVSGMYDRQAGGTLGGKAQNSTTYKATDMTKMVDYIKSRPKPNKAAVNAKKNDSVWKFFYDKYGRDINDFDLNHIATYLGLPGYSSVWGKYSSNRSAFVLDEKKRKEIMRAFKAGGYKTGTLGVPGNGSYWTHNDELIIRRSDGAVLTPLSKGSPVFPANLADNLWKWGSMTPTDFIKGLGSISVPDTNVSNTTTINNHYDTLLTVNGDIDKEALPELKEILKQACEYTNKHNAREARKLGKK